LGKRKSTHLGGYKPFWVTPWRPCQMGIHHIRRVMKDETGLPVFCGTGKGAPILNAYEQLCGPCRQRRYQQLGILRAFCPRCHEWRTRGRALHEDRLLQHASHCVECSTVRTGYKRRIVAPWNDWMRRTRRRLVYIAPFRAAHMEPSRSRASPVMTKAPAQQLPKLRPIEAPRS
jgi:hypothetical protein